MDLMASQTPPAVVLMCTRCQGSWPADWLLEWEFTTCPNCSGELRPPMWVGEPKLTRRAEVEERV